MMKNIIYLLVILTMLTLNSGCRSLTYTSIVPIAPLRPVQGYEMPWGVLVNSPQVILEWTRDSESGVKYDVALYEAIPSESISGCHLAIGDRIYLRENIEENKHLVDYQFAEKTSYFWTVRKHIGSQTTEWSKFSWIVPGGLKMNNKPFSFCYHCEWLSRQCY